MQDKILSISKAAEYLGVFPLTLRNWEKKGKIRVIRTPGGHRRFRQSDLDILLGISGGRGDKLKDTIKSLESMNFYNGRQEQLNKAINDLKQISEDNHEQKL